MLRRFCNSWCHLSHTWFPLLQNSVLEFPYQSHNISCAWFLRARVGPRKEATLGLMEWGCWETFKMWQTLSNKTTFFPLDPCVPCPLPSLHRRTDSSSRSFLSSGTFFFDKVNYLFLRQSTFLIKHFELLISSHFVFYTYRNDTFPFLCGQMNNLLT